VQATEGLLVRAQLEEFSFHGDSMGPTPLGVRGIFVGPWALSLGGWNATVEDVEALLRVAVTKSDSHKAGLLMSIKVRSKAKTAASY